MSLKTVVGYSANYDPYGNPLEQVGTFRTNLSYGGEYTVTDTFAQLDLVIIHLIIAGKLIETTLEHSFFANEGEWIEAENLLKLQG